MTETIELDERVAEAMKGKPQQFIKFTAFLKKMGFESASKRNFITNKYFTKGSADYLGIATTGKRHARKILISGALKYALVMSNDSENLDLEGIYDVLTSKV